ncbi:DNA polymerase kappa DNA polymerase IV [Perkinsela sp. CCAP 1560/4]|nr:DNA polymerase kappa DNA polymerase IV [Perkinsela sp. CCAP 1560/4]|eukprot:KNH09399.1 DNA polymerase kappa DNA polymerase IV [Perkinsela sp. CCAP 1560/4]
MKLNNLKAGMDMVDVTKVEEVLNSETAKTSEYYKHQEKMNSKAQKKLDLLVERAVKYRLNPQIIGMWQKEADKEIAKYPRTDLCEHYLHMDMDAFFASVEIRDNPAYSSVPLAVGSTSMISTSNYVARKFGVRAGMAGFIALKLCPNLIIVPGQFDKYEEVGRFIRGQVLYKYDPMLRSFSCDEASLNITNYCQNACLSPAEVGARVKAEVHDLTGLTCSIGIGPNPTLAKIASEYHKPNGLHALQFQTNEEMLDFLYSLRVRKIPCLGRRTEDMLSEIGIIDLGDIYHNRGLLWGLLPRKTAIFYILCPLGIFPTSMLGDADSANSTPGASNGTEHSISKERTFPPLKSKDELMEVFHIVLHDALQYFEESQEIDCCVGTITLKLKYHSFEMKQRSIRLDPATRDYALLAETAKQILSSEYYPTDIRLLGIKFTLQKNRQSVYRQGKLNGPNTKADTSASHNQIQVISID